MAKDAELVQVGFRCTLEIKKALEQLADREQRSINAQLTVIVMAALREEGFKIGAKGGK